MPDPRSVMQEFRTLDAKRLAKGLSPEEERRLGELRELVGDEASAGTPRGGGFDVNAAAARLRESLLPAGLRNRPPPPPELSPEPEPEPFFPAAAPAAVDDAPPAAPEAPLFADADTAALFDPASLGWETEPAAPLPPFDPAGQQTAGGDASDGWDPNAASAQGWDSNAAGAQAWDPSAANAGWDPSALPGEAAAWDPAAAQVDAGGQPWDAGASPLEPGAQPWDPGALSADPNGQPWDPNAVAWEPGSAGGDPAAAGAWDPNPAPALDPGALFDFDPATLGTDPAGGHAAHPDTGHGQPAVAEGAWEPSLLEAQDAAPADAAGPPLDAAWDPGFAAELEPTRALALGAGVPDTTPGELPAADHDLAGTASPLDLDAGAFELEPIDDAALVQEDGGASLALATEPASAEWTVPALDAAIPDGFAFDDAAAAPEPTEMLGLASEPEPTQALPLLATDPAPLPPAGWDPVPAPAIAEPGAAFGDYDELAAGGVQLAQGDGLESGFDAGLESGLDASLAGDPSAPLGAPGAGVLGEYDDTAGFAPGAVFEPPPDGGFEAGPPLALGDGASSALDGAAGWPVDGALDPSFELASGGSFDAGADAAAAWTTAEAPAPWETAPVDAALEPLSLDLPAFASEPSPVTESHSLAPALPEPAASGEDDLALPEIVEEIPTIDGEEILEEIPADEAAFAPPLDFAATSLAPAPRPPPAAPPAAPAFVPASLPPPAAAAPAASPRVAPAPPALPATTAVGVHRVVVHTLEGTVKRGVLEDADLSAPTLALAPGPGEKAEPIAAEKVKAIFFMLAPGEAPPAAEGKKVRVTFRDGRQVAGFSPGYREDGPGFFMIPGDTRTNTGRIWVYRAAVKQVAVS